MITEQDEGKKIALKIHTVKKLYHGSDQRFDKIDLGCARPFKDFGKGFYLTTQVRQAQKWAQNKATRKAKAYIYSYRLNIKENLEKLQEVKILELLQYDKSWLDFISKSRIDGFETDHDIIYDRMADNNYDNISDILKKYMAGKIEVKDVIKKLQWSDAADQYCFKTDRAISLLTFDQTYVLSKNEKGLWTKPQLLVEEGEVGA